MQIRRLSQLDDRAVLKVLLARIARVRVHTAALISCMAEVDRRKLYRDEGYASMYDYCVQGLAMSEGEAYRRIRAARAVRRFPTIIPRLAADRLHLTAVVELAPYLYEATAEELLLAAEHKSRAQILEMLAARFPKPDVPTVLRPIEPVAISPDPVPTVIETPAPEAHIDSEPASETHSELTLASVGTVTDHPASVSSRGKVTPLTADRFALQATIRRTAHDRLRDARDILGHQIPSGDLAEVLEILIELGFEQLEKRMFVSTDRPQLGARRPNSNTRHVPKDVKHAVWKRDGGQCTFISNSGHRCSARRFLEYDHVISFARGGTSTPPNIRLRCDAHNQFEAERTFGVEFMNGKRAQAAEAKWAREKVRKRLPGRR
jgi:hypothetical protein